jgi:single-strand DNA-binding protein
VTNFTIATSRRSKDSQTGEWKDDTDWHDVVLWRGENISQYLQKGRQIYVEGRLQTRSWEDQNGNRRYRTEVVTEGFNVILLGGGREEAGPSEDMAQGATAGRQGSPASSRGSGASAPDVDDQGITDDDVPF